MPDNNDIEIKKITLEKYRLNVSVLKLTIWLVFSVGLTAILGHLINKRELDIKE